MTTMTAGGRVPEFTLGWRMRLALETGDLSVNEMASRLGYSRSTISRWLNDQDEPRPVILDAWAHATGADRTWLEHGSGAPTPPPNGGGRQTEALSRLTEQKRSRSQGSGNTRRYLPSFSPEPVAA